MYRDLEKGVYLFVQTQKTQIGNQVYRSEPFIITVPGNYDGQIIWNVTAEPKFKNESIPPITTNTPPVSEEPSGDNSSRTPNVKTGDDTNVIFSIGEKTGYEESIVERLSHPIQCLQPEGTVHNTCTVS